MPLDSKIPLSVVSPEFANPLDVQLKQMNLRQLSGNITQQEEDRAQNKKLSDLYQTALRPDGTIDQTALYKGAAQGGLGNKIPALQKSYYDNAKTQADLNHTNAQTTEVQSNIARARLEKNSGVLSSLIGRPDLNHDMVIQSISGLVQDGDMTPQQGQQLVRELPGDPSYLRPYLVQKGLAVADATKRMELLRPKFESIDLGGNVSLGTVDPLSGKYTQNKSLSKSATPAREDGGSGGGVSVTYQQDNGGNIVALPSKVSGNSVTAIPVSPPGKNGIERLQGKNSITEDQGKALGWLNQATNAYGNMQRIMTTTPSAAKPGLGDMVSSIPLPGSGALGNSLKSADRQMFVQSSESLTEAMLRAATGAGVTASEARQKAEELTPQWGEKPETTAQKMKAIPVYIESLRTRAGNAAKNSPLPNVPADIGAILNKYGVGGG